MANDTNTITEIDPDLLAAWRAFFNDGKSAPFRDPDLSSGGTNAWNDRITLEGLQRVLDDHIQRRAEGK